MYKLKGCKGIKFLSRFKALLFILRFLADFYVWLYGMLTSMTSTP